MATRWTAAPAAAPDEWARTISAVDGGFFHGPTGLQVGAPRGEPLYLRYQRDGQVLGVALAVRSRCRLSGRLRHAYFPCWPAYAADVDPHAANRALAEALRELGVAEAQMDSFGAGCSAPPAVVPNRVEYVIDLAQVEERLVWPPSTAHRRVVRRGEREGWTLERLIGVLATRALEGVMEQVIERAGSRGVAIHVTIPAALGDPGLRDSDTLAVFAAKQHDTLLAAALIGLSPTRAYYLMGGATPAGYQCGASVWLHARLASQFAAEGLRRYNLGGAPASATQDGDPYHGLHRFKMGFGPRVVPCASDRWVLGPGHVRGHQLLRWATRWVA